MASFAQVITSSNNNTASGTSHTGTLPSGIVTGNVLIAFFTCDSSVTTDTPSGWTKEAEQATSGTRLVVYSKTATGSDSITVTTNSSSVGAFVIHRILTDNTSVEVSITSGTSANPNSPSLTPAGGSQEYVWFSAFSTSASVTVSAYPTNYADNQVLENTARTLATASYENEATSEDPGAFTISSSEVWIAATVSVEPQDPVFGNFPIITSNSNIFSPTIDFAGDGNFPILEMSSQIFTPTATAFNRPVWTNESQNTSTWTNEAKSI